MIDSLKPYPVMKDSGVPWLGEVPEHWTVRRLKQLCSRSALYGANVPATAYTTSGVRFLRTTDITDEGRLRGRGVFLPAETVREYRLADGDLLISRSGTVGRSFLYDRKLHGTCAYAGYLVRFVPAGEVASTYLFQFTKTQAFAAFLRVMAVSSTIENVNGDKYANCVFPIPPLPEQTAIVRFLDHVDRRIRRYIRGKQKLIKLLEEQKQAVIHRAVTRGLDPNVRLKPSGVEWLGDVPEHWEVCTLRRVIYRAVDGPHHSPSYLDDGIPFLSARNIKMDRWSLDDAKFISEEDYAKFSRRIVPEIGDVLYTKGGTTGVARAVDLPFRFQVWVHVAVLKVKRRKVVPDYLALVLNSPRSYEQAQLFTRGATNQDLGLARMKGIWFTLPPLSEQEALLNALEQETITLQETIYEARRTITLLREYRTRLIADVVTGKLDVREAAARLPDEDDEPEPPGEIDPEGEPDEPDAVDDADEAAA